MACPSTSKKLTIERLKRKVRTLSETDAKEVLQHLIERKIILKK
jgi:hypothetical protein